MADGPTSGGSRFGLLDAISVSDAQEVSIEDLVGRALSRSSTSPVVLGSLQPEFESAIRAVLEPFSQNGNLEERLLSHATVFNRIP
jgi:hypothetical protein